MTPHARLMAEELPTGTFGHAHHPRAAEPHTRPEPTWTTREQNDHCATLLAALAGWDWDRPTRQAQRRHLRLITTETDANAA